MSYRIAVCDDCAADGEYMKNPIASLIILPIFPMKGSAHWISGCTVRRKASIITGKR